MARILITWELGGGLGHLVRLVPIVRLLRENEHCVFLAARDLSRVNSLFGRFGVGCLQAPVKLSRSATRIDPPRSFAHVLHNGGFADQTELRSLTEAWHHLYEYVKPDLILFDHSPTALLGARTSGAKRAVIGTRQLNGTDLSRLIALERKCNGGLPRLDSNWVGHYTWNVVVGIDVVLWTTIRRSPAGLEIAHPRSLPHDAIDPLGSVDDHIRRPVPGKRVR